jgi:5'-phosphate synthase pdxT subunit
VNGRADRPQPRVGILALQGGFEAHARILAHLGVPYREVRTTRDLDGDDLDALIIPGGESTVMMLGIERERLAEPIVELATSGTPILGTCAGMIVLDRDHLGILDVVARRNAFGRQLSSFETDLELADVEDGPVHAIFIRAPWIDETGPGVQVLGSVDGHPVAVRQDSIVATAFHPELAGETRLHQLVLGLRSRV